MTDEIPPLLPPDETPPIRSLPDLDRFWRSIKGPWGFAEPQVWCVVFGPDGEMTPFLTKIEECPDTPEAEQVSSLLDILTTIVDEEFPGGSIAMMYARPGGDAVRADDRCWARRLTDAAMQSVVDVWPVFLANDVAVRMAAPDDLAA